jgi:CelD/BcsL family acetyltransferase involved in cellulose biosynthesis
MVESLQTIDCGKARQSGIRIERFDPLADPAWDAMVTARQDHWIFHRAAWARVLAETYGHRPFYLRISVDDVEAALVPLMEVNSCLTGHRGISLPFSDFAAALWTDTAQSASVYDALLELAAERKWKHLEMRGGSVPPANAKPFLTYDAHQLDLKRGIASIEQGLDPSVRRAIRKAEKSGMEVTVERGSDAMYAFYDLHGKTRRRHGLPPQPFGFFQSIATHLISRGLGEVVLAKLSGVPVAGAIFLQSGGRVIYKFGASDTAHWPLRPNHLVMWTAIRHFVGLRCQWLHFGRTSQADEGLTHFKRSWGCTSEPLRYFRHGSRVNAWNPARHPAAESHPLIFGRLPIAINRFAGRLIYPHLD